MTGPGPAQETTCCLLKGVGVGQKVGAVLVLMWVEVGDWGPAQDQERLKVWHQVEAGG